MHIYIKFNFIWRNENQKSKSDISEWKNIGQINRDRGRKRERERERERSANVKE